MSRARTVLVERHLKAVYDHLGRQLTYRFKSGETLRARGIVTVVDREQALDGTRIETDMKGYFLKLRRSEVGDKFQGTSGDRLILDESFEWQTDFIIDSKPFSWNRGGAQVILNMTAVPQVVDPA